MTILDRLVKRYRTAGDGWDGSEGRYVCTSCGATYDDPEVLICSECRGLVRKRTT